MNISEELLEFCFEGFLVPPVRENNTARTSMRVDGRELEARTSFRADKYHALGGSGNALNLDREL